MEQIKLHRHFSFHLLIEILQIERYLKADIYFEALLTNNVPAIIHIGECFLFTMSI